MNRSLKIGVVVVLYNTNIINVSFSSLPSNAYLIVVDNTPNQNIDITQNERLHYLPLLNNLGIAEAQNRGISKAISLGCSHIVFFDQDSIVRHDYIKNIVLEYERINLKNPKLFLLGPTTYNGRDNTEYKSIIHKNHVTDYNFIPRQEIISSGSCVAISKIREIGLLNSELFIDFVDFEWCWRANKKGFISGITKNVSLTHFVGTQEYRFLNQLIIISSPIRYYYQTRNYLWLLRINYVPFSWKINNGIKRIIFPLTFPFKVNRWREIYRQMWLGFIDGIKYKLSKKNK